MDVQIAASEVDRHLADRLRIRENASSAVSSASSNVCRYFSVVAIEAWPNRSLTTCRSAPPASNQEAWACLRSWIRTLIPRSAFLSAGFQTWRRNQSAEM